MCQALWRQANRFCMSVPLKEQIFNKVDWVLRGGSVTREQDEEAGFFFSFSKTLFFIKFFIQLLLTYNILLVLAAQQSD